MPTLLFAALVAAPVYARKDNPLKRTKPVPADQPIPMIDFFRPPVLVAPTLNPAGDHFAALVSSGDDTVDLAAFELPSMKIERLTGQYEEDITHFRWQNDTRLLFSVTREKLYAMGLYAADLGHFASSYPLQEKNAAIIVGTPDAEPESAIIWIRYSASRRGGDGGVFKIATRRTRWRESVSIRFGPDPGVRANIEHRYPSIKEGVPVAYLPNSRGELGFAKVTHEGGLNLYRLDNDTWKLCPIDLPDIEIVGVGDQPDELFVASSGGENKPHVIRRLDAVSGRMGEIVLSDDDYDLTGAQLYRDPSDHHLLGASYDRAGPTTTWLDAKYLGIQAGLEKLFPGQIVRLLGSDRAEKQFFVGVSSDVRPTSYYFVDLEAGTSRHIVDERPWIDATRMRPMKLMHYTTRDGRRIDGYVTLPTGASRESPAPLIVLPHGGPWVRDTWGWNAEVQFLASRGYAVFQPNYRGSTGTTWRFPKEDAWQFRKMHDDVTDGVHALLTTGLFDEHRIAIMGGSFGGYLALCGAAYEPGLYQCAITVAGVFDWEQLLKETRHNVYQRGFYDVLRRNLGDPKEQELAFDEISPLHAVDRIHIPVFVAHGTQDYVALVSQSKRLIAALRRNHVPYESDIEGDEGHGFHKLDDKLELCTRIEHFLGKHMAKHASVAGRN